MVIDCVLTYIIHADEIGKAILLTNISLKFLQIMTLYFLFKYISIQRTHHSIKSFPLPNTIAITIQTKDWAEFRLLLTRYRKLRLISLVQLSKINEIFKTFN